MTKNWIAVSAFLMLISGLLGWQLYVGAKRFNAEHDLAKIQPVTDVKHISEGGIPPLPPPRRYNAAEFAAIPNQNVFSETRAREEKTEVQQPAPVPELNPKPTLVGITISGNERQALIVDPTIPTANRQMVTKRPGDVYQGYVITDISESQMVLESGTRREVIPLFNGAKHTTQGGKTPILATRVVSFGASGSSGAAQPVVVTSGGSGAARPPGSGGASVPIGSARPAAQPTQQTQQSPAAAQPQQGRPNLPLNQGVDAQGRTIIRTPFGDYPVATPPKPPPNE
jgi:hypothetical protein